MTTTDLPELVDTTTVAEWLGVNVATVNRKCRQGKVPGAFKFGHRWLIRRDELDNLSKKETA